MMLEISATNNWNCLTLLWLIFYGATLSITRGISPRDALLANLKVPSAASLRLYLDSIKANLNNGGNGFKQTVQVVPII